MLKSQVLHVSPFEYTIELHEKFLKIRMIHNDTFCVWESVIIGALENLDIDSIYDIFEQYDNNTLDTNIKLIFPIPCLNNKGDLNININFEISYGKNRCATKCIIMKPVIIPNVDVYNKRFNNLQNIIDDNVMNFVTNYNENIDNIENSLFKHGENIKDINVNVDICNRDIAVLEKGVELQAERLNVLDKCIVNNDSKIDICRKMISELKMMIDEYHRINDTYDKRIEILTKMIEMNGLKHNMLELQVKQNSIEIEILKNNI